MNLLSPAEAEALILSSISPLPSEPVPLTEALNRVLREPLHADRPFPPFDRVTMDGIAFRNTGEKNLSLHGLHPAGSPAPAPLPPGACWQIMTGAVLPPDCDTIVPYEELSLTDTHAQINGEIQPGKFIHRQGSDAPQGHLLLTPGTLLGPLQLGLAASIGATSLSVTRLPRITILSTGDELLPPEDTPLPHQLRRSNGLTLKAAIESWGPAQITLAHLPDDLEATTTGIAQARQQSDLIILSGGISKGKKDYVRPALESLIGPPLFHGVAQRPGKPLACWPGVAALPGNPNSTFTTFQRYLVPALRALVGLPPKITPTLPLAQPLTPHPKLTLFYPALLNPVGTLNVFTPQNSGDFLAPLAANGIIQIPPGTTPLTHAPFHTY
ncbi:MAG: molybdopterin molybdotransferase MoeA [Verrucomicrobiaceae bacterium]